MQLIDSHCHLDPAYFPEGAQPLLRRGRQAGLEHFVVIGVGPNLEAAHWAIELAQQETDVSAVVGMHPHEARLLTDAMFDELERLVARPEVVAVGEIGLDFHYMHSPAETQQAVFRQMIALARQVKKPIVVHSRSAPELTLRILAEEHARDVGGVLHCFSEDRATAVKALGLDFDVSFSGIVTYKTARSVQDTARWIAADRFMVETDCPYLAPVPLRGKRNEPAFVVHTARFIAELRGQGAAELARQTSANARRRFGLPRRGDQIGASRAT